MSFRISHEVRGFEQLGKRLEKMTPRVRKAVFEEIVGGTLKIHGDAVKSIQAQGSRSKDEIRYDPKRKVRVSAPGNPPNSDTGALVKSIQFDFDKAKLMGRVGTNSKYGAILELTPRSSLRRPWLGPAYRKNIEKIFEAIKEIFSDEVFK